ncbi:MAG TPA: HEAT repeat domain-containing protein [Pirellulaceae bacterium]|jgi:hypothetical protein
MQGTFIARILLSIAFLNVAACNSQNRLKAGRSSDDKPALKSAELLKIGREAGLREIFIFVESVSRLSLAEQKPYIPVIYHEVYPEITSFKYVGNALPQKWAIPFEGRPQISPEKLADDALEEPFGSGCLLVEARQSCVKVLGKHSSEAIQLVADDLSGNERSKIRGLKMIGALRLNEFVDQVLSIFETEPNLAERASYALRDIGDPRVIGSIVRKYPNLQKDMIFEQLRSLQRGEKPDLSLVERLGSTDAGVRWRAAYSLAESGDAMLAPYVERLLKDEDSRVRKQAANIGFCMNHDDYSIVRPLLIPSTRDENFEVRSFVAKCFAQRRDPICAPVILGFLKDDSISFDQQWNYVQDVQQLMRRHLRCNIEPDKWRFNKAAWKQDAIAQFTEWIERLN